MFKLIFYIIITYSFAFSQWVEEGGNYKLIHDMYEIKELRYSIDTTHIILINDEKISYYNKYSGEFSKSFSVPVISEIKDTLNYFVNPRLSLDEKILSYNNEEFDGDLSLISSEIVLIDLETHDFLRIDERNYKGGYPTFSPTTETFVFFESLDNNIYYHNYIASIPKQAGVAKLEIRNHLKSASSVRIESMYPHVKFNPKNKTIAVQNIKYKNKLILIDADSSSILGKSGAHFDFETSDYKSAHYKYFEVDDLLCFANDEEHLFYQQNNNLVKYNYIDKSKDTFLGDFNYERVMYLKNDVFLGIKDSILTVLDGMDLNKLYQYNVNVKAELCFFDSLNNHLYFKNENNNNIYNKTLDLNDIDTLVSLFKSKEYVLVGDKIDFTNVSIGQYDKIQWSIDENLISNEKYLSHTFTSSGTYTVKLKLTKGNIESTYEKLIPVYDRIKADFDIEVLTEDIPFKVKIINKVKDYSSLYWYLNGKSIDLKNDSTILISEYGEFEIKQFIRDDFSYNETTKKITLYPKVFTQEFKDFKTIKKNKVNIDYFEEQDNFTVTYIEKSNTHFYLVKDNSIFYDYNIFEPVYKHRIPQNPPVGYSESGYEYSMHNNYPILYFNNYDELKYFENTFYVYEEYFYSYPPGYDFTYRFTTDTTKEVITENFIYDIDFNENEMILKDKTKETTIKSNYNKYLAYKDKNQNSIILNNKKYFVQNHQLYYFDFNDEEIYHYENVFRDLSEYYFAIINSELQFIYKDLKNNWYILLVNENNELIKNEFKYSNELIIKDIFGLNDRLYLASKNNKIFEYDLITKKEVELENIELDTIQVINELKDNLVLFGKKDEFLAYQIINKNESYFNKYESLRGNFINAITNNKDKYLAQIKIDKDTINTYLALLDIYSFLDVKEKNFHQIKIINNTISSSEIINSIYIYDLLGNVVFKEENYNEYNFNIEQLNRGFYLYRIVSNEKEYTGKFFR